MGNDPRDEGTLDSVILSTPQTPDGRSGSLLLVSLCFWLLAGPAGVAAKASEPPGRALGAPPRTARSAGLELPAGFRATVFADGVGPARHLVVRDDGGVYVALCRITDGGGVVGLRDTDGDGRADRRVRFAETAGTGIAIHGGYLYFSSDRAVFRARLAPGRLAPAGAVETVVSGFPDQPDHLAKSIALDAAGRLYVNVGAPSNACMHKRRTRGSLGVPDCPQRRLQAGVWRFPAGATGMSQTRDGHRFAAGLRNSVALTWNPIAERLFVVQHGRDQLRQLWKHLYSPRQGAMLPAEELHVLTDGSDAGWPYTYWDGLRGARMIAPEYGGDGATVAPAGVYQDPLVALPAHWGPNAILFYTGRGFPERYRGGAFIAFHGSWNRSPLPQQGYNVVFVPFAGAVPTGGWEIFLDGFAGTETIIDPGDAEYRPTGLAQAPDGALYVADSKHGRIWRVTYEGS